MRTYKRENLTPKERELLAELLQDDLEEARKWAKLYRADNAPKDLNAKDRQREHLEEIEEKQAVLDYLNAEGKDQKEPYFIGYLTAYIRTKAEALRELILEMGEDVEIFDKEAMNALLHKKAQFDYLKTILSGGLLVYEQADTPKKWEA